jgi:hypothetical protein
MDRGARSKEAEEQHDKIMQLRVIPGNASEAHCNNMAQVFSSCAPNLMPKVRLSGTVDRAICKLFGFNTLQELILQKIRFSTLNGGTGIAPWYGAQCPCGGQMAVACQTPLCALGSTASQGDLIESLPARGKFGGKQQDPLVCPPGLVAEGSFCLLSAKEFGIRVLSSHLQMSAQVVGPRKGIGTATLSRVPVLPVRFSEPTPSGDDPRCHSDHRQRKDAPARSR